MKTKTYHVKTYDTNISGNNQHNKEAAEYASISKPEVQDFEDLLATSTDAYLDAYENNNLDQLKVLLNSQRSIRKELTVQLRNYPDQRAILSAKLVQTYNIFNKILQSASDKRELKNQVEIIINSHSNAKDILTYLYKHPYIRHKTLLAALGIPRGTLTGTLQVLEQYDCIERIGEGWGALYTLTNTGRKYVRDNVSGIDDEVIIDYDSFQKSSYQLVQNKALYTSIETEFDNKGYRRATQTSYSGKNYDTVVLKYNI